MDFLKDLRVNKKSKRYFLRPQAVALFGISQTIILIFFSFLKANIWRGLRCHTIFFLSVHSLPWGLPRIAKKIVWHLRLLEIFELENDSPGSFMHFQDMTFRKLQIYKKSLSTFVKALTTGYSNGPVVLYYVREIQSQSCSFHTSAFFNPKSSKL